MAIIGNFTTTANAITGQVRTLTVSMKARLVPIEVMCRKPGKAKLDAPAARP